MQGRSADIDVFMSLTSREGAVWNRAGWYADLAPMMADNTYLPATMRSTTWKKDLTVIGDFASDLGCPTPLFGLASALHMATLAAGHGAEDSAAVCATLEQMAGVVR